MVRLDLKKTVRIVVRGKAADDDRPTVADLIALSGMVEYAPSGHIRSIRAEDVHEFPPPDQLPKLSDILDPEFTNGLPPVAYLEKLRGGEEA